jgi:flagellar export protein FliJ
MARFQYRLQPLLDLKTERKEQLELALAERRKELAAEQEALAELEQKRDALRVALAEALRQRLAAGAGASGHALGQHTDFLRGLTADVMSAAAATTAQALRVRQFERLVDEARRQLAEAVREVEVLKKHRERVQQRFLREQERKDAVEQDDMGNVIFNSKRRAYESSF